MEIKVLDVNDNSLVFVESVEYIVVLELVFFGVELLIIVVIDDDIGKNGV